MATISLPSWFDVLECEMTLVPEVRGFQGPFGGPTEVQDLLGDRWRMRATLPDGDFTWGGRTEALFNRLRGGADWLRLHHFAKPVPRGTARGSMVLSASVTQGAATLALAGLRAGEWLPGSGFEVDSNADGLSDLLTAYASGTYAGVTRSRPGGTWGSNQRCAATTLGGTSADQVGFAFAGQVPVTQGLSYSLSADMFGNSTNQVAMEANFYSAGNAFLGRLYDSSAGNGISWARRSVSGVAPVGAAYLVLFFYMHTGTGGSPEIRVDNVQLEQAAAATAFGSTPSLRPPTLLAGDMLGHNGEQLFQVYSDATANDIGSVTVSLSNRARKAIASGQAIVWDRPDLPFQLLDASGVPTAYTRGRARGQQVEFVEAWQA